MTALVLQLAIAAATHAAELNQLYAAATAEGRDITPEELGALRGKAVAAIDALMMAHKP